MTIYQWYRDCNPARGYQPISGKGNISDTPPNRRTNVLEDGVVGPKTKMALEEAIKIITEDDVMWDEFMEEWEKGQREREAATDPWSYYNRMKLYNECGNVLRQDSFVKLVEPADTLWEKYAQEEEGSDYRGNIFQRFIEAVKYAVKYAR